MVKCRFCKNLIEKEVAIKHPDKKNFYFCCQGCLKNFDEKTPKKQEVLNTTSKEAKPFRLLTDYIQELYGKDNCNWPLITAQIDNMVREYDFIYEGILLTLKYCYEELGFDLNIDYGIEKVVTAFYEIAKKEWIINRDLNEKNEELKPEKTITIKTSQGYNKPKYQEIEPF